MSIVDIIKQAWYQERNTDIYNSDDFDELFKSDKNEEQEPFSTSRLLSNFTKKKNTTRNNENNNKEIIKVIENPAMTSQSEVVVIEPRSFDEALEIIEELRCRRSVVLNLQYLDADQSQRVVDFLSGATHALDGHQQRVGQGVFIFAPNNFVLTTESNEARALKDAFWGRTKEKMQEQIQYITEPVAKKSSIF